MFTNAEDLKNRQNIDLGSKNFDIKSIFGKAIPLDSYMPKEIENQSFWVDDYVKNTEEIHLETEKEMFVTADAIDMPTYGCKDGVCSI
jgi:hypothetical protein